MKIIRTILSALAGLVVSPHLGEAAPPAGFDQQVEMRFAVVRGQSPGCGLTCEWISAEGKIVPASLGGFRSVLKSLGAKRLPIYISSPGGDVNAGMAIGRLIRAKGLDVGVMKTMQIPERGEAAPEEADTRERSGFLTPRGAFCASACTLVLAGGARRLTPPGVLVGVHEMLAPAHTETTRIEHYLIKTWRRGARIVSRERIFVNETKLSRRVGASKPPEAQYRRVGAYLKEMGVARDVVALMKAASPQSIRWLTRAELAATKLSTDPPEEAAPASTAPPAAAALGGRTIATLGAKGWAAIPLMVAGSNTPPLRLGDEGRSSPIGREAGGGSGARNLIASGALLLLFLLFAVKSAARRDEPK